MAGRGQAGGLTPMARALSTGLGRADALTGVVMVHSGLCLASYSAQRCVLTALLAIAALPGIRAKANAVGSSVVCITSATRAKGVAVLIKKLSQGAEFTRDGLISRYSRYGTGLGETPPHKQFPRCALVQMPRSACRILPLRSVRPWGIRPHEPETRPVVCWELARECFSEPYSRPQPSKGAQSR